MQIRRESNNVGSQEIGDNMKEFDVIHQYGEELERRLRLKTFPLAVKLLEREEDIPKGAQRPMRDFGYHLSLCQAFLRSRVEGTNIYGAPIDGMAPPSPAIAMLKEDMWCPEPIIGYGLAEAPPYFLEGHTRFPGTHKTLEAGRAWAQAFPRLEVGKYIGVVSAPLSATNFKPDLVVIYCDSAQISLLISAANRKEGEVDFPCRLSPSAACVRAIVPVIQEGRFHVALPCWGDRTRAMAQDSELIFSVPVDKVQGLLLELRAFEETGRKMPVQRSLCPEHEMPDSYVTLAKILGVKGMKGDGSAK